MRKNLSQIVWISFYVTVQDMAFILASSLQNSFYGLFNILSFALGIIMGIFIFGMLIHGFWLINFPERGGKNYQYQHMFLLCYDYDLFPTYELLDLPRRQKQLGRYSNLRIVAVVMKVAYSFLIVGYI